MDFLNISFNLTHAKLGLKLNGQVTLASQAIDQTKRNHNFSTNPIECMKLKITIRTLKYTEPNSPILHWMQHHEIE
ncbi:hypothetical protein XFLM_07585 [Xylella fastidiosa subsp. fastidiosa GB514]|nr:hypothetical protein XFLM_07585 [Xylella fastidiosa subsp. fastidiosa GB514]RWA31471.1 hypothetical protein XfCFBP8071_03430 [Xylella fastidiosa subsp. fastidiosa]RWA42439.1 hypothetical protein XfCFBP8351_03280 [Xylella fastidiosa subsp. fastidiosa]TNW13873.1 hypothetical protein C5H16_01905 [Xylella fastidiosa]